MAVDWPTFFCICDDAISFALYAYLQLSSEAWASLLEAPSSSASSRAASATTAVPAQFNEVFMDVLTQQFGDDIEAVRQAAGFEGTGDQVEMFVRALMSNSLSFTPEQAQILATRSSEA
jgi:hypothetical protein